MTRTPLADLGVALRRPDKIAVGGTSAVAGRLVVLLLAELGTDPVPVRAVNAVLWNDADAPAHRLKGVAFRANRALRALGSPARVVFDAGTVALV